MPGRRRAGRRANYLVEVVVGLGEVAGAGDIGFGVALLSAAGEQGAPGHPAAGVDVLAAWAVEVQAGVADRPVRTGAVAS